MTSAQDIYYVQESRKEDGSFYVILPQAPEAGKQYSITVQYEGDKVLESAGDGSYYVRARSSWYPNLNGFGEHSLYDLTFKVPKKYKVISIGKLKDESMEQDYAVTHWVTPVPVAVAGFNYGNYQKLELADEKTGFKISGYYLTELPNNLSHFSILRTMAPKSMTKYALEQTRAQLQLCSFFFGKIPYDEISVTEQPDFNFGQSWPNLVYLPDFSLHGFDAAVDAVRQHQQQIHRLCAGGNAARGGAPMVGPRRGLGFLPRSVAFRGFCRILRRAVSATGRGRRLAQGLR